MAASLRIAITGASGFIGRWLDRRLTEVGHQTICISRRLGHDICDYNSLNVGRFDVLIHLAAMTFVPNSVDQNREFFHTNMVGTLNALELCRENDAPIVYASSYVYGPPERLPIDESHRVGPWNPYAASKLQGEELCRSFSQLFSLPARILRPFNVYGPGQKSDFLIPTIVNGIRAGHVELQTPHPKRDFVHVVDVVEAMRFAAEQTWQGVEVYNVGSGTSHSVQAIVELAQAVAQSEATVAYSNLDRQFQVMDVVADTTLIRERLNWQPTVSLAMGLNSILAVDESASRPDWDSIPIHRRAA